jgi:type VI secretion system protein VasI
LDFYINWGVFIDSQSHEVTIRIDADEAVSDSWSVSTDHTATFYTGDRKAYFEALNKAKKLVVRTTPYGESPVLTTFNVAGFSNVSPALLKACGQ